jgi:hypothetical protein
VKSKEQVLQTIQLLLSECQALWKLGHPIERVSREWITELEFPSKGAKEKVKREENEEDKRDSQLEFYVNGCCLRFGDRPKCSCRKNHGSTIP